MFTQTSNFWPTAPLFIPVHFTCTLPLPSQHMLALMSYLHPSQKEFLDAYEFLHETLESEKREKNYFFVNSTYKITIFLTQIYIW